MPPLDGDDELGASSSRPRARDAWRSGPGCACPSGRRPRSLPAPSSSCTTPRPTPTLSASSPSLAAPASSPSASWISPKAARSQRPPGRRDLRRGYLLHGGSSCLGWTSSTQNAADGSGRGRRDRPSKFYEIPDNLFVGRYAVTVVGCLRTAPSNVAESETQPSSVSITRTLASWLVCGRSSPIGSAVQSSSRRQR